MPYAHVDLFLNICIDVELKKSHFNVLLYISAYVHIKGEDYRYHLPTIVLVFTVRIKG